MGIRHSLKKFHFDPVSNLNSPLSSYSHGYSVVDDEGVTSQSLAESVEKVTLKENDSSPASAKPADAEKVQEVDADSIPSNTTEKAKPINIEKKTEGTKVACSTLSASAPPFEFKMPTTKVAKSTEMKVAPCETTKLNQLEVNQKEFSFSSSSPESSKHVLETYHADKYAFSTPPVTDSLDDGEKERRKQALAKEQQQMILQRVQDQRDHHKHHGDNTAHHWHTQQHWKNGKVNPCPIPERRPRTKGVLYQRLPNGKFRRFVSDKYRK